MQMSSCDGQKGGTARKEVACQKTKEDDLIIRFCSRRCSCQRRLPSSSLPANMWPPTHTNNDNESCSECPLHCASAFYKAPRPKTGLYGKIAELQVQMQHMQSMHLQERDCLLHRLQEEEECNRATTALNTQLSESLRRHHINVMTDKDTSRTQVRHQLRRSKSYEALHGSSSQRLNRICLNEENDYDKDERLHTSLPQSYETTSLNGSPTMAPIQEVDEESEWVREKERLQMLNEALSVKVQGLEKAKAKLEWELKDTKEQSELLEFRVLELEETGSAPSAGGCAMLYPEQEAHCPSAPLRLEAEERRLRCKETEFRLKLDALKCERDETVALLEGRLVEMQRRHEEALEGERAQWQVHLDKQKSSAKTERDELLARLYRLEELLQEEQNASSVHQTQDEVYEGVGGGCGSMDPDAREREAQLEQRVFELEQKQLAYRATIAEADRIMANVERTYQERVDELELSEQHLRTRITQLEQSEKRLQRSLINSSSACASTMSSTASDMEKRNLMAEVADREARVRQLEDRESALRETLAHADVILAEREKGFRDTIEKLQIQLVDMRAAKDREATQSPSDMQMEQFAAELQNLSAKEDNVRSLRQKVNEISERIKECDNCEPLCGPLLVKLGSEVKQLDEIIFGCNTPTPESGRSTNCPPDLEEPSKGEKNLEEKLADSQTQISYLKCQLEVQDAEMRAMDQEASLLQSQLEARENETRSQHEEIVHLREQFLQLKMQMRKADLCHRSTAQKLEQRNEELAIARARCSEMERRLVLFTTRTRALESAQQERDTLLDRLTANEAELTKRRESEHRLCAENLHMHHKVEGLRERINSLQLIKRDHKALLSKHSSVEKKLATTEATIATLQSQITRLKSDCKEKDRVINQLRNEQQRKNKRTSTVGDGERKVYSGWVSPRTRQHHSTASSDDSGIHDLSPGSSGESEASDDATIGRNTRLIVPRNYACLTSTPSISSSQGDSSLSGSITMSDITESESDTIFTSPSTSTINSRGSKIPRYLPLQKYSSQDLLSALKESSSKASSQNSLLALGNHSSDSQKNITLRRDRKNSANSGDNDGMAVGDKHSLALFPTRSLSQARVMTNTVITKTSSTIVSKKIYISGATDHAASATDGYVTTPVTFNVTRKIGQDGLLVAWEMPNTKNTREEDTVSGYQIFVNGNLHQKVRSAHRTKALLNNLNLNKPLDISIHALSSGGILSPPAFARFTPEANVPIYI